MFTDGAETHELFRGHRTLDRFSPETLLRAARGLGNYLQRSTDENGRFVYKYLPKRDYAADSYNILRHAGTTYAMLELYEATKDEKYLASARKSLAYLEKQLQTPSETFSRIKRGVVEGHEIKLGGNGLAIVAFCKYTSVTGDRRYVESCQRLANWIASTQEPNGRFAIHKVNFPSGFVTNFRSEYYPGEAVLGLCRLYQLDKNPKWLDVAAKNARYAIVDRDAKLKDERLPHDHWLLYALNDLHRIQPNEIYLDHTRWLVKVIVEAQIRESEQPDWIGGFSRPPRSTRTSTRCEGLLAAYAMLKDFGNKEELPPILDAVQRGTQLQFATRIYPETAMYLPDPQRSVFGMRKSLTDYTLQIDYQQHSISSFLAFRRLLLAQGN